MMMGVFRTLCMSVQTAKMKKRDRRCRVVVSATHSIHLPSSNGPVAFAAFVRVRTACASAVTAISLTVEIVCLDSLALLAKSGSATDAQTTALAARMKPAAGKDGVTDRKVWKPASSV